MLPMERGRPQPPGRPLPLDRGGGGGGSSSGLGDGERQTPAQLNAAISSAPTTQVRGASPRLPTPRAFARPAHPSLTPPRPLT